MHSSRHTDALGDRFPQLTQRREVCEHLSALKMLVSIVMGAALWHTEHGEGEAVGNWDEVRLERIGAQERKQHGAQHLLRVVQAKAWRWSDEFRPQRARKPRPCDRVISLQTSLHALKVAQGAAAGMPYWLYPNARTVTIEPLRPGILTVGLLDSYELGRTMKTE